MPDSLAQLAQYRAEIDACDAELVALLARRFAVTEKVGELKARAALPGADLAREQQQIERLHMLAQAAGIAPEQVIEIWQHIVKLVKQRHQAIAQQV